MEDVDNTRDLKNSGVSAASGQKSSEQLSFETGKISDRIQMKSGYLDEQFAVTPYEKTIEHF